MDKIHVLLNETKMFNKNKQLTIVNNSEHFNMFRICGVDHYENTHSSIIAEILTPNGTHNYKGKFLEAFLQTLKKEALVPDSFSFSLENVTVTKEFSTKYGRLDLLIKNSHGQALLIENKIYAADQFKQLQRYYEFGCNEFGSKFKLIYLTLWGTESPQTDKQKVDYIQVSYKDVIVKWLDRCIEIAVRTAVVRETLIQYSNHIKNLTDTNTQTIMNQELIRNLSTKENLESAFIIANNIDNVKNYIINTSLLPQLEDVSTSLGIKLDSEPGDYVNTNWAGFRFIHPSYKNYDLFMEFGTKGLKNLIIGFCPKNENIDNSALAQLKSIVGGGNNRCAFKKYPNYTNWGEITMKAILDGVLKNSIHENLSKLIDDVKDIKTI